MGEERGQGVEGWAGKKANPIHYLIESTEKHYYS